MRPQHASSSSSSGPMIRNDDVVPAGAVVDVASARRAEQPHLDPPVQPMQDVVPLLAPVQEPRADHAAEHLAPPPPQHPRVAAGERMDMRGKLTLSAVYKSGHQIGWGANCGICQSLTVRSACKKQLPYGGKRCMELNDDQCRRKLKKWLTMCIECPDRESHVSIDARSLPLEDEAELDQTIQILRETL